MRWIRPCGAATPADSGQFTTNQIENKLKIAFDSAWIFKRTEGICMFFAAAFEFHPALSIYANRVYSCRAADLNENPLAGDHCYWSPWASALSKANWSITTGWLGLMEHDCRCPAAIINTTKTPMVWVNVHFSVELCCSEFPFWLFKDTLEGKECQITSNWPPQPLMQSTSIKICCCA